MFNITLFLNHCKNVRLTHHEIFLALELELCATVLAIQYLIACLEDHFLVLGSLTNSLDGAVKGFLLSSIRTIPVTVANTYFRNCFIVLLSLKLSFAYYIISNVVQR